MRTNCLRHVAGPAILLSSTSLLVSCGKPADETAAPIPAPSALEDVTAAATKAAEDVGEAAMKTVDHAAGLAAWGVGMCHKCHEDDGTGGKRAPDLTDDEWLHCDGSVAGILFVLRSGVPEEKLKDPSRPFAMNPATNLVKGDAALEALAEYVASLSKGG